MANMAEILGKASSRTQHRENREWKDKDWMLWLVAVVLACFILIFAVLFFVKEAWLSYLETACRIYVKS